MKIGDLRVYGSSIRSVRISLINHSRRRKINLTTSQLWKKKIILAGILINFHRTNVIFGFLKYFHSLFSIHMGWLRSFYFPSLWRCFVGWFFNRNVWINHKDFWRLFFFFYKELYSFNRIKNNQESISNIEYRLFHRTRSLKVFMEGEIGRVKFKIFFI